MIDKLKSTIIVKCYDKDGNLKWTQETKKIKSVKKENENVSK